MTQLTPSPVVIEQSARSFSEPEATATNGRSQPTGQRPNLFIGLGGTGQQVALHLKVVAGRTLGENWQDKIAILVFDTTEEQLSIVANGQTVELEPSVEFFNIGNVPTPNIRRNIEHLHAIQERLGPIMSQLPPTVLRSGAKQLRPLGLLAFLWHFQRINREVQRAIWTLAGRDQTEATTSTAQQGINVFICGSLVGGTGAGTFLDMAYLVRAHFEELGTQAEFCHITGVGVLPQAFQGIQGQNIMPNAAVSLEELNHLMVNGGFQTQYPDGRVIASSEAPFNLFYLVDGVDERGQTWSGLAELTLMIAEALFLQMSSQLGRKGENAFDNVDEVLIGQDGQGHGTFYSSLGMGYLEFDAPAVARLCTRQFLQNSINQVWLKPVAVKPTLPEHLRQVADLDDRLLYDPETETTMRVELTLPGWLPRKAAGDVAADAAGHVNQYGRIRLEESYRPQIEANGRQLSQAYRQQWEDWVRERLLDPEWGILLMLELIKLARSQLNDWMATTRRRLQELEPQLERQSETVAQYEAEVGQAATSFPLGRSGRIRTSLDRYFQAAATWFEMQLQQQVWQTRLRVWHEVDDKLHELTTQAGRLAERLGQIERRLRQRMPEQIRRLESGGVGRLSLADAAYLETLYQRNHPTWVDLATQAGDPLALARLDLNDLQQTVLARLSVNFDSIRRMTVESVLREQHKERGITPRARRQQLFRLATPSWNVDRTRLPDGGAGLVRLEVMGVPDEKETLFADEPMLVATHDPYRLMALVVVAGAPQTALQQYERYRQAVAQVKQRRTLHVLPTFLTGDDEAHLAFALGSIFGFIYSQGTYFYYQPADRLDPSLKLANGLHNSIELFTEQSSLVTAVRERVEAQIAQLGLRQAITILTDYYRAVPNGNTALDEELRRLKRLVRDYTDGLRRIDEFSAGLSEEQRLQVANSA